MHIELRILTGLHSGARVLLDSPQIVIGADHEADVQISDWSESPIALVIEDANVFCTSATNQKNTEKRLLPLLHAERFGSVVLCVGPADQAWPSELSLLQALIAPEKQQPANHHVQTSKTAASSINRFKLGHTLGKLAVVCLCAAGVIAWYGWPTTHAATPPDPQVLLDRFHSELNQANMSDVHAHRQGNDIYVEGFVANRQEYTRVQQWISKHPGQWHIRVYDANAIAQAMFEALGEQTLNVDYLKNGMFRVTGNTANSRLIRQRVSQLTADFADQIAGIQLAITELDPKRQLPRNYASALAQPSLYYVETPDGTKHFNFQSDLTR